MHSDRTESNISNALSVNHSFVYGVEKDVNISDVRWDATDDYGQSSAAEDASSRGSASGDDRDKAKGDFSGFGDEWVITDDDLPLFDLFMQEEHERTSGHAKSIDLVTATLSFAEERRFTHGSYQLIILLLCATVGLLVLGFQLNVARAYDISKATEALFLKDIQSVTSRDLLWQWLANTWVPGLFAARIDGVNSTVNAMDPAPPPLNSTTEYIVQDQSKLALGPTLRQYRYRATSCSSLKTFVKCLQPYSYDPYRNFTFQSGKGFVYTFRINADEDYPTNEYTNVTNLKAAQAALAQMKNQSWIDRSTAFVVAQSVLYSPHFQLVTNLRIVFVLKRTGLVIPYAPAFEEFFFQHLGSSLKSTRLNMYDEPGDYFRGVLEVIYILITVWGFVRFVRNGLQCKRRTGRFLPYVSLRLSRGRVNLLDLTILILSLASIISHVYFLAKHAKDDFSSLYSLPSNFSTSSRTFYFFITAVMVMVFTLRLLSSINFHPPWRFLTSTLSNASSSLFHFGLIFLMLLWFYSFVGFYYFGHNLAEYRGIWRGVETLLSFASSGQTTADVTALSGPGADVSAGLFPSLFYWSFVFVVVLVLINMFLAIILGANREDVPVRVLPKRRLHKKLLRPIGSFMLDLFQSNNWVDSIEADYPIGHCKAQFTGEEVTLRVSHLGSLVADAKTLYLVLPAEDWDVTEHTASAQWVLRGVATGEGSSDEPIDTPMRLVFRERRAATGPVIFAISVPHRNWYGYPVTLRFGIKRDIEKNEEKSGDMYDQLPVHWTRANQLAVVWGLDKEDIPVIPLRALVPPENLEASLEKSGLQPPKRVTWEAIVTYCRKSFSYAMT
eukprot:TRINITY_DN6655_c0_g1_i1.p1 TRINITY_DN6655_c0_g1~~TRINITY_DN6655_c0_g1_i1.p1  ORF type:complete len:839 (-),score=167.25 TRINITY_DN6655_c0_g1_i1:442-2958(-)